MSQESENTVMAENEEQKTIRYIENKSQNYRSNFLINSYLNCKMDYTVQAKDRYWMNGL